MATLTGKTIANTYKDLLQVSNNNGGVDGTLRTVSDGEGTNSPLQLSNSAVNINGTFQLNGNTLTATASALNAVTDLSGVTGLVAMTGGTPLGRSIAVGTGLSVTNADGVAGNPTVELDSTAVVAGSYGPVSNFAVNAKGQVVSASTPVSVSIATIRTSEFVADNVLVSSNVSVKGDVLVSGGLEVLGDVSSNHLYATSINVSVLNASQITVSVLNFITVSVSTITTNQLVVTQRASVSALNVISKVSGTTAVFTGTVSANEFDASIANFNGRVSVGGAINVTGAVSGTSAVFTGIVSANEVDASIANFNGRVSVGGAINVTGAVSGTSAVFTGLVSALSFYGDGSNLTNLPTAPVSVSAYTVNVLTVVSAATVNGIISATNFVGGGAGLTNVSAIFAASATNATNAVNATSAVFASSTTNATNAVSAVFATSATNATNAVNATNATSAVFASSATNATNAVNATNATSAVFASSATNATNAVNATNATSAVFASSATNATIAVNVNGSGYVITSAGFFSGSVSVSSAIVAGAGTVNAPSYSTTGDTNTGIYFPAADTIAVATSAVERVRIDSSGNVGIGTSSPGATLNVVANTASDAVRITQSGAGNALVVEDSTNPDATPFVVEANGRLIVGSTSTQPSLGATNTPQIGVFGNSVSNNGFANYSYTFSQSASFFNFAKSRSTTPGSFAILSDGDDLGYVKFIGDDGTQFVEAARIWAEVDGTPGTNDMPGRLMFSTTGDGASTPTERMRIDSSGNVGIGTSSPNVLLHLAGSSTTALARIANTGTGAGAFDGSGAGLELLATGMNNGANKYAPAIKFGSTDADFTTTNPKYGAAIVGTAAQTYSSDTTGGMNLEFWTAPINPGTGSGLVERMRIDNAGNVGIGTNSPTASLHVNGSFLTSGVATFTSAVDINGATSLASTLVVAASTASDAVRITQTGTGNALVVEDSTNPDATPFVINSVGVVINGATTSKSSRISSSAITPAIQQVGSTNNTSNIGIFGFNSNPGLLIAKSNGTEASPTAVVSGNTIARISGAGFDGTNYTEAGSIRIEVDGTPGTDDMPGRLVFNTTGDGASSPTERMRIDSSGNVGIGTSSPLKQLEITKSARAVITSLTDATSISVDFNTAQNFAVMLTGNRTLENPTNCVAGQTGSIFVMQNVSGGKTLSFGSNWKFAGAAAPTLTTTASAVDRIDYIVFTSTAIQAVATLDVR